MRLLQPLFFSLSFFLLIFSSQAVAVMGDEDGGGSACTGTATASASDTSVTTEGGVRLTGSLSVTGGVASNITYEWTYTGECSTSVSGSSSSSSTTFTPTPTYNGSYEIELAISFTCNTNNYTASDRMTVEFNVSSYTTCGGSSDSESCADSGDYYARGVDVSGNYAYVANGLCCNDCVGLQIFNVSNPVTPYVVGNYYTTDYANGVAVNGNYSYVAAYNDGLKIIDVSDPANPTLTGSYDTIYAISVIVNGDYAYVTTGTSGLKIINISDPANPSRAGAYDTSNAEKVTLDGVYAYVADNIDGLQIIDASTPTSPALIGNYSDTGFGPTLGVAVNGDYAYLANGYLGLEVIDISDPTTPTLLATLDTYDTSLYAQAIAVGEDYVYLADKNTGLVIINISDPTSPSLTSVFETPGSPNGVAISGRYAYVADGSGGLQIIDISDPSHPTSTIDSDMSRVLGDIDGDRFVALYSDKESRFYDGVENFLEEFGQTWPGTLLQVDESYYYDSNPGDSTPATIETFDLVYQTSHGNIQYFDTDSGFVWLNSSTSTTSQLGIGDLDYLTFTGCLAGSANYCDGMSAINRYTDTDNRDSIFAGLHIFSASHGITSASSSTQEERARFYADNLADGLTLIESWFNAVDDSDLWVNGSHNCAKVTTPQSCGYEKFKCDRWNEYASSFYIDGKKNETLYNRDRYSSDPRKGDADYDIDLIYEYQDEYVPIYSEGYSLP